ncbi:hypothetical protein M885DRAFT_573692 [Pelagophyceae sp. CCMP2097]|nr:hypothetical protein M885DRAFT_573692 [Pelagophyceae sp. CCMP2097]
MLSKSEVDLFEEREDSYHVLRAKLVENFEVQWRARAPKLSETHRGRDKFRRYGAVGGRTSRTLGAGKFQAQACPNSRSVCKDLRCRSAIRRGELRLGKVAPSLSGSSRKVAWYHVECLFEAFKRSSYVTKTLTDLSDLELIGDDLDALRDVVAYKPFYLTA